MSHESLFTYILLSIVTALLVVILYYRYKSYLKSKKTKNRFARGRLLENQARYFLIAKGYKIVEEQKQFRHKYYVNKHQKSSLLKVDYYVSKNGKKYLVEVKSGQSAISASNSNTRRQLLEYSFAIPNDGILLLDMENQKIKLVEFYSSDNQALLFFIKTILIISAIGILLPFWSLKITIIMFWIILFILKPNQLISISQKLNAAINNSK